MASGHATRHGAITQVVGEQVHVEPQSDGHVDRSLLLQMPSPHTAQSSPHVDAFSLLLQTPSPQMFESQYAFT